MTIPKASIRKFSHKLWKTGKHIPYHFYHKKCCGALYSNLSANLHRIWKKKKNMLTTISGVYLNIYRICTMHFCIFVYSSPNKCNAPFSPRHSVLLLFCLCINLEWIQFSVEMMGIYTENEKQETAINVTNIHINTNIMCSTNIYTNFIVKITYFPNSKCSTKFRKFMIVLFHWKCVCTLWTQKKYSNGSINLITCHLTAIYFFPLIQIEVINIKEKTCQFYYPPLFWFFFDISFEVINIMIKSKWKWETLLFDLNSHYIVFLYVCF